MWLIDVSTLYLCNFYGTVPPYAILSHTWGSEEVTFKELSTLKSLAQENLYYPRSDHEESYPLRNIRQRNHIRYKDGFYKISKAAAQAHSDGLAYVWVDTCCIDKSSSAELSEAINSMFRWYKNAAVCYVYLDDADLFSIKGLDPEEIERRNEQPISEELFSKARWFTRGWTLQELIAPGNVVFYHNGWHNRGAWGGWNYIGDKKSMTDALSRITGISVLTLQTGDMEGVSVARKMSWAAKRVTTRAEDMAYCLMGIFDVNMPLLYGEGGEKAFVRLQEEIMKDSDDESLFAWQPRDAVKVEDIALITPMTRGQGRSAFAAHPSEFSYSGDIKMGGSSDPFTITNKGIRMRTFVSLVKRESGLYILILNCYHQGSSSRKVGIVVQESSAIYMRRASGPQTFVRHSTMGLVEVNQSMATPAELTTVYIRKKASDVILRQSMYNQPEVGNLVFLDE
jgi:hypothetical protein